MWALRRFPTSKSLNCIRGFLSVCLNGQHEITTSLRIGFGETETEWKEATS